MPSWNSSSLEQQRWTSATPSPSAASTTSTVAASTPPPTACSAAPPRPRTSCRTSSCASGATRRSSGRAEDRLKVVVAQDEPRADAQPDHLALASADRSTIRDALGRLPGPQREALVLAYWGGMTADQIAARAGVPLGTAKSRIRLGLARLRTELRDLQPAHAAA